MNPSTVAVSSKHAFEVLPVKYVPATRHGRGNVSRECPESSVLEVGGLSFDRREEPQRRSFANVRPEHTFETACVRSRALGSELCALDCVRLEGG